MNTFFRARQIGPTSPWLMATALLFGLATTKARADDNDHRRHEQGPAPKPGQLAQPQQGHGDQDHHNRGDQRPAQGPPERHDTAPVHQGHTPPPMTGPMHPEHQQQQQQQHFEHGRALPPPAPRAEPGRPQQPLPSQSFERARPMPGTPVHAGHPLPPPRPIYAPAAPPQPRYEAPPPRPSPTHIWISGTWGWEHGQHVWIGGQWQMPPEPGYEWESARWHRRGHRWLYNPGHWRPYGTAVVVQPMAPAPAPVYEEGGITISGHVASPQGAPVAGITVTLAGSREGRIVTDGGGGYVFSGLAPGSYSVRATGGNCAFAPDVVNLNNLGYSVTQNITVSGCGGW